MKLLRTALLFLSTAALPAAELPSVELFRDPEIVEAFSAIPVQESGRIKPLENLATYRLLRFRARRSLWLTENGEMGGAPIKDPATQKPIVNANGKPVKLSAVEWLLVSWFRPDIGRIVPLFKVDNSAAVTDLGLKAKAKRDQYSAAEIEPARDALLKKLEEYGEIPPKKQTPEQRILVQLATNYLDYEMIASHFDFIRAPFGENPAALPNGLTPPIRLSKSLPTVAAAVTGAGMPPMQLPWFRPFGQSGLGAIMSGSASQQFRLFPPADKTNEVWMGPGDPLMDVLRGGPGNNEEQLKWLAKYEDLYLALPDAAKFKAAARALQQEIQAAATARGEAGNIPLERFYMKADFFFYAQWVFLFGLVLVALTWISPGSGWARWVGRGAWLVLIAATLLAATGILVRCIIMQRPPITVLYETIIFIGTAIALFGLIVEAVTRRGLGLLVTAVGGTACMFLAVRFEASDATDTMQQLQAVLITNFWLSTHVPLINLGYAACMVAALISMVYFFMRLTGMLDRTKGDGRFLTRIAYGFIAAGLFLSLVGTVLGGIWANYSWGRFWGWDPKENGALMIVLACLAILHLRLGGFIREAGIHCCNLILGCIVVFSWFGVNQLGVGLHAYGFTDGTWPKIYGYWLSQIALLGYGLYVAWGDRHKPAAPAAEDKLAPAPPPLPTLKDASGAR